MLRELEILTSIYRLLRINLNNLAKNIEIAEIKENVHKFVCP